MTNTQKYCGFCGKPMDPDDLFCGSCGKPVVEQASTEQPVPSVQQPPPVQPPVATLIPDSGQLPAQPPPADSLTPEPPVPKRKSPAGRRACGLAVVVLLAVGVYILRCTPIGEKIPQPGFGFIPRSRSDSEQVTALAFSIDQDVMADPYYNFVACGTAGGGIHIYDANSYKLVDSFEQVTDGGLPVAALIIGSDWACDEFGDDYSYCGEYIVWTSSTEAGLIVWDPRLQPGQRILSLSIVADSKGTGLRLDPFYDSYLNGIWVFNVADQAVRGWDYVSGDLLESEVWPAEMMPISRLSRSTNGRYAALEFEGSYLAVCDSWEAMGGLTDFGAMVCSYDECYLPAPSAYAVGSTGLLAVTGGGAGQLNVLVHDFVEGRQLWELSVPAGLTALAFSYHGDRLAGGGPGFITLWDVYSGEVVKQLDIP